MWFARWVQRQSRLRLFLVLWSVYCVMYAAAGIGAVVIGAAAFHPGRAHLLPAWPDIWIWVIGSVPGSACLAAFVAPGLRRGARTRLTRASRRAS